MIVALVQFALPERMSVEQARQVFASTAPRYLNMPGLVRKHYLLSEDGRTAGGMYVWQSRADAERQYGDEWRAFVRGKYGVEPQLTFFESPVSVDNVTRVVAQND